MKGYNFEGKSPNLLPMGENGLRTKVCPSNLQRRIEPSPAPVPKKIIFGVKQFTSLKVSRLGRACIISPKIMEKWVLDSQIT